MTVFAIDDRGIRRLEAQLERFAARALPHATRATLSETAESAQDIAQADLPQRFTLRNQWTRRSIGINKARGVDIRRQQSAVGSVQPYMEDQEFGATRIKRGKHGIPIPTPPASGQARGARRTRPIQWRSYLSAIRIDRRARAIGRGRRQRNAIAISMAGRAPSAPQRYALIQRRKKVIVRVSQMRVKYQRLPRGKSKLDRRVVAGRIDAIYDIDSPAIIIPPRPWLRPAVDEAARMLPAHYAHQLRVQLDRAGLFR